MRNHVLPAPVRFGYAAMVSVDDACSSRILYCFNLTITTRGRAVGTRCNSMTRRLRVQFSLRAMLLAFLVAGPLIALMHHSVYRAAVQRRAVAAIERKGGSVFYDYQFQEDGDMKQWSPSPPGPAWLRRIVGDDCFREVTHVTLKRGGLDQLASLRSMENLSVPSSLLQGDDPNIGSLRGLARLRRLWVEDDSGPCDGLVALLSQLTQLRQLCISQTLLTKKEVGELKKALPDCAVALAGE